MSGGWEHLGDAQGNVMVPAGKALNLNVSADTSDKPKDLPFLSALGPDDLYMLDLSCVQASDECLARVKHLTSLRRLRVNSQHVTDKGLLQLRGLKALFLLNVHSPKITRRGIEELTQALPRTTILHKKLD